MTRQTGSRSGGASFGSGNQLHFRAMLKEILQFACIEDRGHALEEWERLGLCEAQSLETRSGRRSRRRCWHAFNKTQEPRKRVGLNATRLQRYDRVSTSTTAGSCISLAKPAEQSRTGANLRHMCASVAEWLFSILDFAVLLGEIRAKLESGSSSQRFWMSSSYRRVLHTICHLLPLCLVIAFVISSMWLRIYLV